MGEKNDPFFQTGGHLDEKLCEISYLADRHIISDECANFAQLLAKKVTDVAGMDISRKNVCQRNRKRLVVIKFSRSQCGEGRF